MTRQDGFSPETALLLAHERDIAPAPDDLRVRALTRAKRTAHQPAAWYASRPRSHRRSLLFASLGVAFGSVAYAAWHDPNDAALVTADGVAWPLAKTVQMDLRPHFAYEGPPPALETSATAEPRPTAPGPVRSIPGSQVSKSSAAADSAELALLQRARAALAVGNDDAALDAISEHQKLFPSSPLREEREALRIRALEGLGRDDEARRAGEKFRERYPKSVLSPRLGAAERGP
jgi:hypothetical protein